METRCTRDGLRSSTLALAAVLMLWLASSATPAHALFGNITVNTLNDDNTHGDQLCTLREAIDNANSGGDITSGDCQPGDVGATFIGFSVSGTIGLSSLAGGSLPISAFVSINGGNTVTLSGGNSIRIFILNPGVTLTLQDLVLTDGYAGSSYGGAIYVNNASVILNHATIQNSHTNGFAGSAIFTSGGSVSLLNNSVIQGNYGADYGAINSTGIVTVTNSIVHGNRATAGGGALSVSGPVLISNSQIYSNSAPLGGGLYLGGSALIANSQLVNNTASNGNGGGINALAGSGVTVDSSLIASNVATGTVASPVGGGIYSEGSVTLTNTSLSGNRASQRGGGIEIIGTLSARNSSLSDNRAFYGGGIADDGGNSTLVAVSLSGNSAEGGGGITNFATMTLTAVTLNGNTANFYGGGGINTGGTLTLISSTVSANTAPIGGGISNGGLLNIYNSTLSNNQAATGGGIDNGWTLNLANSTLSGNSAVNGGGVSNERDATLTNVTLDNRVLITGTAHNLYLNSGVLTLTNTIVNFNASYGANCFGAGFPKSLSLGHNIANDTSCVLTNIGDQQSPLVPILLGPLANHGGPTLTQLPRVGSAAIDGGDDAVCNNPPINHADQRGLFRPQGAHCDVGAVERQPSDTDSAPWLWLPLVVR